jgi:hypothetical protein
MQRFRQHTHAPSGFGPGVPIVVVDFFISAHAGMGLVVAIGLCLADLPCSLMA